MVEMLAHSREVHTVDDPTDTRPPHRSAPALRELPPFLVAGNRFGSYGFGAGLSGLLLAMRPSATPCRGPPRRRRRSQRHGLVRYAQDGATNRDTAVVGLTPGWIGLFVLLLGWRPR